MDATGSNPQAMYRQRFDGMATFRNAMWKTLCESFFNRYSREDASVMEIAAGHCEFINHIRGARRVAVDINPDIKNYADKQVETFQTSSTKLDRIDGQFDLIFTSNFLEHITKPEIINTLKQAREKLTPNGQLVILQPNIRYVGSKYWMFFDHITPLCHDSLAEALEHSGFTVQQIIKRFLPYSSKATKLKSITLLKLYLAVPLAWPFLGQQSLIVATRDRQET